MSDCPTCGQPSLLTTFLAALRRTVDEPKPEPKHAARPPHPLTMAGRK